MSDKLGMTDTVSNAAIKDLVDTCIDLGEITAATVIEMGVPLDTLDHPELRSPEAALINIWQWLDNNSSYQGLGLKIGSVINPAAKGLLASWVSQANTLAEALTIFCDNIALMSPSESWTLSDEGDYCLLEFQLNTEKGYPVMAIERSLVAMVTWGRALCGVSFELERAEFAFARPVYNELYKDYFGHHLIFDSGYNRLTLSRHLLELPVLNGNEFLKGLMAKAAGQVLAVKPSFGEQVLSKIKKAYQAGEDISVESISHALSVSRQTLFRRLKKEECDFKGLLDQFKKERSLRLLHSDKHNITSVALSLGYKDSSSFTKAFKRWYGLTPKEYISGGGR